MSWVSLYGVACLAGIGFTMSLFIGGLSFSDATHAADVRLEVLSGSIISAVVGFLVLRFLASNPSAQPAVTEAEKVAMGAKA